MAKRKERQYVSDNARLMAEWNWEKNNELTFDPQVLTVGSERKAWWRCSSGHEWQASIANRDKGNGCPYCSGKKVLVGYNDLQTVNPILSAEWNDEKNGTLQPIDFSPNSGKKVWWKCQVGHTWLASIYSRNNGHGCPYCSGRLAVKGKNDLQTVHPTLAAEWNFEKNDVLRPEQFLPSSAKKVWWKCCKGHEWQATINHRSNGRGCPICDSERKTSFPEYAILYYLKKCSLEVIHTYKGKGYELDVYIPSKQIAIEYDGYLWHNNRTQKDLEKNFRCKRDGITLYRLREGLLPLDDSSIDFVVQRDQKDLGKKISEVLYAVTEILIDVDLARDAIAIENLRERNEKESSLAFSNPEAASEWNYEKNGCLKPEGFSANSSKKVWWKCSRGHEWQAAIASRNKNHGCPYCSGRYAIEGENDLGTANPTLADEWNYEKNKELKPENFTTKSSKKVWWKCSKGHEWQAVIYSRSSGTGCPYCSGNKVLKGYNDLKTVNPTLADEWNYEKNKGLTPADVVPGSDKKEWWKCNKGHEWQSTIGHRSRGRGCPQCAKEKRVNPLSPK